MGSHPHHPHANTANTVCHCLQNKMFRFCADLYVWSSSFQALHYANIVQMFVMLQNVRNNFVKRSKCLQKCQEWKQSRAKCHPIYTSFDSEVCRLTVVFIDVKSIAINITIFRNNLNICWNFPTCPKTFWKIYFEKEKIQILHVKVENPESFCFYWWTVKKTTWQLYRDLR